MQQKFHRCSYGWIQKFMSTLRITAANEPLKRKKGKPVCDCTRLGQSMFLVSLFDYFVDVAPGKLMMTLPCWELRVEKSSITIQVSHYLQLGSNALVLPAAGRQDIQILAISIDCIQNMLDLGRSPYVHYFSPKFRRFPTSLPPPNTLPVILQSSQN